LIIFGKQHQHTFKNDMHIQLSLSFFIFYLLYLLLSSYEKRKWRVLAALCARERVQLLQQETSDFISPELVDGRHLENRYYVIFPQCYLLTLSNEHIFAVLYVSLFYGPYTLL